MTGIIKLAVLAVGGQGGGVLTNWIADLATRNGYAVQMTSVAGVAQRTGATIYYVEMALKGDRAPVFSLAPAAGDVDILVAAELMEAGRSVMRGFITPDRTVVVASDHRVLAMDEKIVPGDGRGDSAAVLERVRDAAKDLVCFDMEQVAVDAGSMISASLFGGLARSGALPFDIADFEATIKKSGRGVDASLRAFDAALNYQENDDDSATHAQDIVSGPSGLMSEWTALVQRADSLPSEAREMAEAGLRKVVDYQDLEYGQEYLGRIEKLSCQDPLYLQNAAKYIANAMCYDDILKVADLKTRSGRQKRLRVDQQINPDELVQVTEYFHPRGEEFCTTLPAGVGQWIIDRPKVFRFVDGMINRGRRVRTDGVFWFAILWLVAGRRKKRRGSLRHKMEMAHLDALIKTAENAASQSPAYGAEVFACQRLIKGYSDTHVRGTSKFDRLIAALAFLDGRDDAADWVARLRTAALQDEHGAALDGAIATLKTLKEGAAA